MTTNAGLKGVDWSQYAQWPSFVGADGHTYYIPPGGQGYAYDPFLHHLFQDGRAASAAKQKEVDDATKAQKDANSPVRQLGTIAGVAGVTAGIPIIANRFFPTALEQAQTAQITSKLPNAGAAANGAAQNSSVAGSIPSPTPIGGSAQIGTNVDGTPIFADGGSGPVTPAADPSMFSTQNLTAAPGTFGQVVSAAAAAKGAYDTFQGFQNNGAGVRSGLTEMGGGLGTMFGGPVGGAIGAVGGNVLGYGLQGNGWKNDAALMALGPPGWAALAAKKVGIIDRLTHQTTRDFQKENTQNLLSQSDDPTWQGYVSAMRGQNETGPSDASMPYSDTKGNKYSNFEDYKAGGLDAANLTGVQGNLATYGPEWAKLTEAQRQAVTQKNIDSNLYSSHKGEVVIDDPIVAKQNYDSVVGPTVATPPGAVPVANVNAAVSGAQPVVQLPGQRTTTLSPGIGLNGQRIRY
jgi:hypothetical protein